MTSLADRTIAALRANHDELVPLVGGLTEEQLAGTSGASDWTVAQVLSHLGSGAEIMLTVFSAALDGTASPDQSFNQSVWDRWNALSPRDQAEGSLEHDERLVAALEGLSSQQRESVRVALGFGPSPLSLAAFGGMRLSEAAHHSWDVRVALDPSATLADDAAEVLLEQLSGEIGFLLGFTGKADALSDPAVVALPGSDLAIVVDGAVSISSPPRDATATFRGEREAVARLLTGRLSPTHTPAGVEVTGNVTLDELRRVFPGY